MITKIIENIAADMLSKGYKDKHLLADLQESISLELGKYEWKEKVTAVIMYDDSDAVMIQKFFINKMTIGLSPKSLDFYRLTLSRAFKLIGKHIKEINSDDIRSYLTVMRVHGAKNISLDNARRVLNSFFTWAVEEDYIRRNPVNKVKKIKFEKKVRKPLTEEEMERLRMFASNDRNRAIIEFLYSTGCRVSEMTALSRYDINWDLGEVVVMGKGNKERKVFLSPRCIVVLKRYLDSRKDNHEALFVSDYSLWKGGVRKNEIHRFTTSGVEEMIRATGKRAEIEHVHPHRIRHTAATVALRRGMPIEQISKMLGHSNIETTTIYANSTTDDVKDSHRKYLT